MAWVSIGLDRLDQHHLDLPNSALQNLLIFILDAGPPIQGYGRYGQVMILFISVIFTVQTSHFAVCFQGLYSCG